MQTYYLTSFSHNSRGCLLGSTARSVDGRKPIGRKPIGNNDQPFHTMIPLPLVCPLSAPANGHTPGNRHINALELGKR